MMGSLFLWAMIKVCKLECFFRFVMAFNAIGSLQLESNECTNLYCTNDFKIKVLLM